MQRCGRTLGAAPGRWNLGDCLLNAAIVWIILGLVHQVCDLWAAYHGTDLTAEERCGWHYEALWRVAVAVLLAAYCVVSTLVSRRVVVLPEREGDWSRTGKNLVWAVLCLSLLAVLSSVPRRLVERRASWWSRSVDILACVLAVGICVWVVYEGLIVLNLVYIGSLSLEMARPPRLAFEGLPLSVSVRANRFLIYAAMASAVSLLNLMVARQLSRSWPRGPKVRWILGSVLGLGLAVSAGYLAWLWKVGVWSLSPPLASGLEIGPVYRWALALVLLSFPAIRNAYRHSVLPAQAAASGGVRWRRHPRSYYHERFAIVALLLAAFAGNWYMGNYVLFSSLDTHQLMELVEYSFTTLPDAFHWAVFIAAIGTLRASWRPPAEISLVGPPALPPGRFLAAWAAQFLALVLGFPAIIALAFGIMIVF